MEFYRRHVCRIWPFPDDVARAFREMSEPVYHTMNGPNEFTIVGTMKDIDLTDRLPSIRVPTLVTGGRYDEVTPKVARSIRSGIPRARQVVFERSSHLPFWEERDRFLRVVARFLASVDRPRAPRARSRTRQRRAG
jgi:proline-specific peptidase